MRRRSEHFTDLNLMKVLLIPIKGELESIPSMAGPFDLSMGLGDETIFIRIRCYWSIESVESDWNRTVWWEVREGIGMISCAMGIQDLCWTLHTMGVWDWGWGQTSCGVGVLDRWGTSWVRIDEGFGVEINSVWSISVGSIGVWGPAL